MADITVRQQKAILRRETAAWQCAAIGLLALSVFTNTALGGLYAVQRKQLESESDQLRKELRQAESVRDMAVRELGSLSAQVARDKCTRLEQAAAEGETQKLDLNPTVTANIIEDCTITYYCAEKYPHICGFGLGITETGAECNPGHMVAVDPNVIPLHSKVIVDYGDGDLRCYFAEDVGGSVKGNHIDIMCETHDEAVNAGKTTATVYWIEQEEHQ